MTTKNLICTLKSVKMDSEKLELFDNKLGANLNLQNILIDSSTNRRASHSSLDLGLLSGSLIKALNECNVYRVEHLLNKIRSIECKINWREISLAEIIFNRTNVSEYKCKELLVFFLKYGLPADYHNKDGNNLLHLFISSYIKLRGDISSPDAVKTAKILLDAGVPLDEPCGSYREYTPLMYAINSQSYPLVKFFIKKGAAVNVKCTCGIFPLFEAAKQDNVSIVNLLLSSGAKINAKTECGQTALHQACFSGNVNVVNLLMQKGADISVEDDVEAETPFSLLKPEEDFLSPCIIIMIREIAKRKFVGYHAVSYYDLYLIQESGKASKYYAECNNELTRMKSINFYSPYSYYCVLKMSENIKKLSNLTKNAEFVEKFHENLSLFPLYKSNLQHILATAKKVQKESLKVYSRLWSIFGNFLPDIVIRKLSESLDPKDLPSKS